jgi:hypothetical protein
MAPVRSALFRRPGEVLFTCKRDQGLQLADVHGGIYGNTSSQTKPIDHNYDPIEDVDWTAWPTVDMLNGCVIVISAAACGVR